MDEEVEPWDFWKKKKEKEINDTLKMFLMVRSVSTTFVKKKKSQQITGVCSNWSIFVVTQEASVNEREKCFI